MRASIILGFLLLSAAARAAVPCTTSDLQLEMSLVLPSGDPVGDANAPYVFGAAECQCHSTDLALRLKLFQAIPIAKANGQLQVWVGAGCDQQINRTSGLCRQVVGSGIDYTDFVQGTNPLGPIDLPLSSDTLFGDTCEPVLQENNIYILFADLGRDIITNPEVCEYELQESALVTTPVVPTATATDGAVTLTWSVPAGIGEQVPFAYQVLCADADGNPVAGKSIASQAYSVCNGGVLSRRNTLTAASGTTSAAPTSTFDALDPAFRCSETIAPSSPVVAARIDGLDAGKTYQFIVVAVDNWGNPVPSSVVAAATPAPPAAPESNGCDYPGTRTTPHNLGVVALALLLVSYWARRRRSTP
jgi:hypothetical protein